MIGKKSESGLRMSEKKDRCLKCNGDYNTDGNDSPKSSIKTSKRSSLCSLHDNVESIKVPVKPLESNYVAQIVSIGVRSDNIYEAQMLLAPEVDMSSIKITVKADNLRVTLRMPLNDELKSQLPEIVEKSPLGDLVRKTVKYCVNLLIPEVIDGDKVRAIVNNKKRILILTAPTMKPSKARKKYIEQN